MYALIL